MLADDAGLFYYDVSTNETIRETLPEVVVQALTYLTHLGDGAVLVGIAVLLYWFGSEQSRERRAFVLAIAVATLAFSAGLKGVFAIERPDAAFAPIDYPGYTFPSAHSFGAGAIYTALAATMTIGTRRARYTVASVLIVVIALSRVVLGVHYLADVVVGAALGIGLVWVGLRYARNPTLLFGIALVATVVALLLGSREFVTMALGASIGGLIAWPQIQDWRGTNSGAAVLMLGVLVLPAFILLRLVEWLIFDPAALVTAYAIIEVAGYAVVTAAVLAVPAIATKIEHKESVQRLQELLPFRGRQVEPEQMAD